MRKLLKTSKKTLAIFLAVMMMLSITVPAAFAFSATEILCGHDIDNYVYRGKVEPNCTERGYDIYQCLECNAIVHTNYVDANGHSFDEGAEVAATCTQYGGTLYTCSVCHATSLDKDKYQPPLGHRYGEWKYRANSNYADSFEKYRECQRETCSAVEVDTYSNGTAKRYYEVEFINPYYVKTEDYVAAEDGTPLATEAAYKDKTEAVVYTLEGTEAKYNGYAPFHASTEEIGHYKFNGWVDAKDSTNAVDLTAVAANAKVYASFVKSEPDIWEVSTSRANGAPTTKVQDVLHGNPLQYPFATPTKADDAVNHYEFDGWIKKTILGETKVENGTKIYSSGVLLESFKAVPKRFKIEFYNGDILLATYVNEENGDTVAIYGENISDIITPEIRNTIVKDTDNMYEYAFSGKWVLPGGQTTTLEEFTFNAAAYEEYVPGNEDDETLKNDYAKGIIKLQADYFKKSVAYRFELVVMDIDGETPAANGAVQVLNSAGQFSVGKRLDENGVAAMGLVYDKKYTLQVVCNGNVKDVDLIIDADHNKYLVYDKEGNLMDAVDIAEAGNDAYVAQINLTLELDNIVPGGDIGEHSCICHSSLFARPWIAILNAMYRLFGRKIVCCPDMYERHGSRLAYTK